MEKLRIETLGGFQVQLDGEEVKISRRKAAALLVYLAVTQELHPRDSLAALLWPENDQSRAYANLRQVLWEINRSLGEDWLEVTRDAVRLAPQNEVWLDVQTFNQALALVGEHPHARTGVCDHCLAQLQQAAGLVHGDFLAGFSLRDSALFDDWQFFQADEFRRKVGRVYRQLVFWHLEKQEFEQAVEYAQHWLHLDELNENAHRALMQLYAANGQRNAAIRQYQTCVQVLKRELGISPEPETTELYQSIRSGEVQPPAPEPEDAPEPAPLPVSNLPAQLTPFVGRGQEIQELTRLLIDPDIRLLTILAPGGMGKSRLAVEAARRLEPNFEHGAFFVPLAPLQSSERILNYIADVIGYTCCEGLPVNQQLLDSFRDKTKLLILDNFEHLLENTAWVSDLLAAAPGLKILATSRQPLNIQVENRFHLTGLEFPGEGPLPDPSSFSAVKLFLQSARRAQPAFKPAERDWPEIAEICRLVGGMPLGIQMASAWLEMLTLPEIVQEIRTGLDIFETDISDLPERQHSLRTVLDYSWKMLSDEERRLLPQLSIFRGGFTRQAAEEVIGVSLRQLVGFASRSLLTRTPNDRFEIHELLRQYGLERLQQDGEAYRQVKTRYTEYYCQQMRSWEADLKGARQRQALLEIDPDYQNVRTAYEIAAHLQRYDLLDAAYAGLMLYLHRRVRYEEASALCTLTTEIIPDDSRAGIRLLLWAVGDGLLFNAQQGKVEQLDEHYQRCKELLARLEPVQTRAEKMAKAFFHYIEGSYLEYQGDYPGSHRSFIKKALPLFIEVDEWWWSARIYRYVAIAAWSKVDLNMAYEYFEQAVDISRQIEDQYGLAVVLERLGWFAAYGKGDLPLAEEYLREASQIFKDQDDLNSYRRYLYCLEQIANINGRFDEVLDLRHKHLQVLESLGDRFAIAHLYMLFGEAYHHVGDYAIAEIKGRKSLEFTAEGGSRYFRAQVHWFLGLTLIALGEYQQARDLLDKAVRINRDTDSTAHLSGALAALARVEIAAGDLDAAQSVLLEGLQTALDSSEPFMMLYVLASAALFLAHRGQSQRSLELYALVDSWEFAANSRWFADVYRTPLLELTGTASDALPSLERQPKETLWQAALDLLEELSS